MKPLTQETLLDMVVSLLHPKIAPHITSFIRSLSEINSLRQEMLGYFLGPLSAWLHTQASEWPMFAGILGKQTSDGLNFATAATTLAANIGRNPPWQERAMQHAQQQIFAAENAEEVAAAKEAASAQLAALQELHILLYPPSPPRKPIDWGKVLQQVKSAVEAVASPAASGMKRFADWAESLPHAKRA